MVRTDNGGEFTEQDFVKLCNKHRIRRELTTADSPELNGVAERQLSIIKTISLAARIQAPLLFPAWQVPEFYSFSAASTSWACHTLNLTTTTANPSNVSPYERWHFKTVPLELLPFLKLGFCKQPRPGKPLPKVSPCFFRALVVPPHAVRVLLPSRSVINTRYVTWRAVKPA